MQITPPQTKTTRARINPESQKLLAKLLAKENITVSVGNYSTAFFDPKKRLLGLPTWNTDSKSVSDLLVGHEVGHALYTSFEDIEKFKTTCSKIPFGIMNIVEDIRIERMIQRNYPGLVHSFKDGYRQFIEKDFFKIKGADLRKLNFADRLNIHGKIGNQIEVPLSIKEKKIYDRCYAAETFDEVIEICKDIYEMIKTELEKPAKEKQPKNKVEKNPKSEDEQDPTNNGIENLEEDEDSEKSAKNKVEKNPKSEDEQDPTNNGIENLEEDEDSEKSNDSSLAAGNVTGSDWEPDSSLAAGNVTGSDWEPDYSGQDQFQADTLDALSQNLDSLKEIITDYHVGNQPNLKDMMSTIVPIKEIMASRRADMYNYERIMNSDMVKKDWKKFKESSKKHLEVLVKEFERKKAVFQYSRAQQSNCGVLDAKRLYSYKFTDRLFKSITNLADAKNHGMMFFIDYSASMRCTITSVIDQTLQLVLFCKAVGIPFEIYGFTGGNIYATDYNKEETIPGYNISFNHVKLFELLNSSMKKADYDLALKELKAQSCAFGSGLHKKEVNLITMPLGGKYEILGMTPLYETIIIAHELVKRFRAKHNIQKMNTLILSDGAAHSMLITKDNNEHIIPLKKESRAAPTKLKINGGKEIRIYPEYACENVLYNLYAQLIENLKVTCNTTVTGFFIANNDRSYKETAINAIRNSSSKGVITPYYECVEIFKKNNVSAKKERCMIIENGYRYDAYFVFDKGNSLNISDKEEFTSELSSDDGNFGDTSSQNKLAKEFSKFNKERRISRVFLDKFIEIIA